MSSVLLLILFLIPLWGQRPKGTVVLNCCHSWGGLGRMGTAAFPHSCPLFLLSPQAACLSPATVPTCRRAANGHSTSIPGRGLGKQSVGQRCKACERKGEREMPLPMHLCAGERSCWGWGFPPQQAVSPGPRWLQQGAFLFTGARDLWGRGRVFQQ